MTEKNWGSHSSVATTGILVGLVGLITLGYTSFAVAGVQQPVPAKNRPKINAPSENAQVSVGNSPKAAARVMLRQGMQYKEARKLLIQQGWQANLSAPASESPNLENLAVKKLFDLGYQEIKDCSGTGLGLCRFEFTNQTGELLVVITTGESENLIVKDWFTEKTVGANEGCPRDAGAGTNSSVPN